MFDAILLIAGKGTRSGLDFNKVLYKVDDEPVFWYSLKSFLKTKECNKVVLVINIDDEEEVKKFIREKKLKNIEIVIGGEQRQDSVMNGLEKCASKIVLIHDGARPFINKNDILSVYNAALEFDSATLAVKTIDTIKEYKDGKLKTLNRDNLYNIQTPQAVNLDKFKKAITNTLVDGFYGTDDVSLLEKYFKISPKIVEGSYKNIKITTKEDIEYFEYLIRREKNGI